MLNLIGVARAKGGAGSVTSVTASSPLQSSGGATPDISILLSTGSGSIVLATSPTIVTPTIASFANATHTHQNAAGGGSLDTAAIGSGVFNNGRINFASPADIGTGTPAAGSFTALTVTGATPASIINTSSTQDMDILRLWHNKTGAGNDGSGLSFDLNNSAAARIIYGRIFLINTGVTAGSESGAFLFSAMSNGTLTEMFRMRGTQGSIFNELGNADLDFRIEGDTDANLFFTDASLDSVMIGAGVGLSGVKFGVAPDTDATTILGRARIASPTSDVMYLSHYDFSTTSNYALYHNSSGQLSLNTAPGQDMVLQQNNAAVARVNANGVGIGITPAFALHVVKSDVGTGAVTDVAVLSHNSTGTPGVSFGTGLRFQGESSTTDNRDMARLRALWTTATDASRVANLILSVFNVAAETDVLTLTPSGSQFALPVGINVAPTAGRPLYVWTGNLSGIAATQYAAYNLVSWTTSVNNAFGVNGVVSVVNVNPSSTANLSATDTAIGVVSDVVSNGAVGTTIARLTGFYTTAYNGGAGAVTEAHGLRVRYGTSSTGALGTAYGIYLDSFKSSSGPITTLYGLYINDKTQGTTNYAIVTNAGLVVFNEGGHADADVRIEGDTDANLFFTDASADMIGFKTNAPTAVVDINSDILRLRTAKTPASAAAAGNAGDIAWDATYFYVCIANATWHRVLHATW